MKKQKEISELFYKMQSKGDLLVLLNYVLPLLCEKNDFSFTQGQLNYYSTYTSEDSFPSENNVTVLSEGTGKSSRGYATFKVTKKSGKFRTIHAPHGSLKLIQKCLNYIFQNIYTPHAASYGFIPGKSIVDNAQLHTNKNYVYNVDLKDFFPSIDQARVRSRLLFPPFNLGTSEGRIKVANIMAILCCTSIETERLDPVSGTWVQLKKNVLPQGAPTSPTITNIICERLDRRLSGLAKRFNLSYSRYADDITFSSMHHVYGKNGEFIAELHKIIRDQSFHVQEKKTRLQKQGYRQEVTGLTVNDQVNVNQRYIKTIRKWIYYWEQYGEEKASGIILKHYLADKGHVKHNAPNIGNVIAGKLEYLKMVRGANNELYLKLKDRFDTLTEKAELKNPNSTKHNIRPENNNSLLSISTINNTGKFENLKTDQKAIKVESTIPIVHNPKELVALLKNFSVNDSALKYTTHSWDAGRDSNIFKDLTEFLSIAKSQYNEFSFQINSLSRNLHGKINNFLFNKEIAETGWGDPNPVKRIRFGWSSPELTEACNTDASLNPEDFILPEKYQIQRGGKTLQKFKHIIDIFKNEIEIRDENSALLNLILQKHDKYLISFPDPFVCNLENKTFYTDLQSLSKALDLIFEGIQKYSQHPEVEYYVEDVNSDRMILNILHKNSFKRGLSIYDDKLNLSRGDFSTIKDKLLNLCDWSIESHFAEGFYRINYLVSDNQIQAHQKIDSTQGFKHLLTFYK